MCIWSGGENNYSNAALNQRDIKEHLVSVNCEVTFVFVFVFVIPVPTTQVFTEGATWKILDLLMENLH